MPRVLVIAGSDSSGGAGMARDIAVLTEHGVQVCCVLTAVTAQTDEQVVGVHHLPPAVVEQQISTALRSHHIDVIKIGMLGTAATVAVVIAALRECPEIPLIVDPVVCASSGARLLDEAGVELLRTQLLPRTLLLTPNVFEAAMLLHEAPADGEAQLLAQGKKLLDYGVQAVLLKGGHTTDAMATDLLFTRSGHVTRLSTARIAATLRGTGCALASAIAAHLSQGAALESACRRAKDYVRQRLENVQRS